MKKEDLNLLQFIYDRLECVHEENVNYDYMIALRGIIERGSKQLTPTAVVQAKPEVCDCQPKNYNFFEKFMNRCLICEKSIYSKLSS